MIKTPIPPAGTKDAGEAIAQRVTRPKKKLPARAEAPKTERGSIPPERSLLESTNLYDRTIEELEEAFALQRSLDRVGDDILEMASGNGVKRLPCKGANSLRAPLTDSNRAPEKDREAAVEKPEKESASDDTPDSKREAPEQ